MSNISYVSVYKDRINNNNFVALSPYRFWNVTEDCPFERIEKVEQSAIACEFCFRVFEKYSVLYQHKAKECYLDKDFKLSGIEIKISFPREELIYVEDYISAKGIELTDENDLVSFVVDKANFELTMRQMYFVQITKYNLEEWYYQLEALENSHTPKTQILILSDDERNTIYEWCTIQLSSAIGMGVRPTQELQLKREQLEDRITDALMKDDNESLEKEFFVKTSTRSPKDAVSTDRESWDSMSEVERITSKMDKLKVHNGFEVIELITKSQRIFSDILGYKQYRSENTTSMQFNLILRNWDPVPQDHEFRCYVKNRKICAISQYHCYNYFESLQDEDHVAKIQSAILQAHDDVKDHLPLPNYIIDFGVDPIDLRCQVIELNPYGPHQSSGSALFSWTEQLDLLTGKEQNDIPPLWILKELFESPTTQ